MLNIPKGFKVIITYIYTNQDEAVEIGTQLIIEGHKNNNGLYTKDNEDIEFKIGYDDLLEQTINKIEFVEKK